MSRRPPQPPPRLGRGAAVRGGRILSSILLALAAMATVANGAWAYWTTTGAGTGTAATSTLNPPTNVVATSTTGSSSVGVTWTSPIVPLAPEGYYVTRVAEPGGTTAPACASSPSSLVSGPCTDTSVPNGSYHYLVTAVYRTWTATGAASGSVTVAHDTDAPTVTGVSSPLADGSYKAGVAVPVVVTFSEAITVTGTPTLTLATGPSATSVAYCLPVSGTSTLTCTYNVTVGDTSSDLDYSGSTALSAAGGSIRDGAGNDATLTLPAPGAPGSLGANKDLVIDTTAPTVSSIVRGGLSPTNAGPLSWTVTFSEPVAGVAKSNFGLVTSGVGGAALGLGDPVPSGGSPSATWTVSVTMTGATGTNAGSVGLNLTAVGSIADAATNALSTTSFTGPAYIYDTTAPVVTNVTSPLANGSYRAGQVVPVTVTFSEPVDVTGTVTLGLATGSPATTAVTSSSGSGTNALTFSYTVAAGNTSPDLNYAATTSLAGAVSDAATNNAILALPGLSAPGSLGVNKDLVIDTTAPVVTVTRINGAAQAFPYITTGNITSIGGTCGTASGDQAAVYPLINGAATTPATATCSSGAWNLALAPTLTTDATLALSATQTDAAGNIGTAPNQSAIIDKTAPTVLAIERAGASASVNTGPLLWTVTFSEPVSGVAKNNFRLVRSGISGGRPKLAGVTAVGGSPSATWTVSTTENGLSGTDAGSIGLNLRRAGAVVDVANRPLSTGSFTGEAYSYDTTSPTVSSIVRAGASPANGPLSWTVAFSEPVMGLATSNFDLVTSGVTGSTPTVTTTTASGGSPSATWTVTASMTGTIGTNAGSVGLNLTGIGSITDAATNALSTTSFTGPTYIYDTTAPVVTNVTSPLANGSYRAGQVVPVTVTFTEPVNVTGSVTLGLATGSPATTAVPSSSGSGTNTLTFSYTVAAGNTSPDLNYAATTSLAGSVSDAATNDAILALPGLSAPGSLGVNKDLVIDTTAPVVTVTRINGAAQTFPYATKGNITSIGGTCATAASDATTVRPLINGAATTPASVSCASGAWTVTTALTTDATLTLSATQTDAAGNTGTAPNQSATIDKTAPTVTGVSATLANGSYRAGQVIPVTVTFNEPVTVSGTPRLTLATGSPNATSVDYTSGSGTGTLTFDYLVASGNTSADLDYAATTSLTLNNGSITDAVGNDATRTLAAPGATGSLGGSKNLVIDTTAPTVTGVSSTLANGAYTVDQQVPVTVTFTEPVTVTGTPRLTLSTGSPGTTPVDYTSGSGTDTLTFTYTVAAGDTSADLNYSATTSLVLHGGTIRDSAANNATLTLPGLSAPGSLASSKALVIDTTAPVVTVTGIPSTPVWIFFLVTVTGTAEPGSGPVTVYLCRDAGPPCDAGNATATFTDVAVSGAGAWETPTSFQVNSGTYYAAATQTDAAGNTGTSPSYGPVTN